MVAYNNVKKVEIKQNMIMTNETYTYNQILDKEIGQNFEDCVACIVKKASLIIDALQTFILNTSINQNEENFAFLAYQQNAHYIGVELFRFEYSAEQFILWLIANDFIFFSATEMGVVLRQKLISSIDSAIKNASDNLTDQPGHQTSPNPQSS